MRLASVCQSMGQDMRMSTTGLRRQIDDLKSQLENLLECSHTKEAIEQIRGINIKIDEVEAQEEEM